LAEDKRGHSDFWRQLLLRLPCAGQALHRVKRPSIVKCSYVIVQVDIGEGDKNKDLVEKYKIPLDKGVPALAVLKAMVHSFIGAAMANSKPRARC
jgi:hypothetical protein